ncbi:MULTISPECIES: hypothetical protein [Clostridium]|jgi:hypothetical protein|uniref:hypothetical protein n=1 Tax=Clostridium TaxID=1485 RepID=UPI002431B174|nr:hypothetical protein [Clostridium tyrobutyricum]
MNEYYALFSCDAWKSCSSMRLIGVFTLEKLKTVIKEKIKEKDFYFACLEKIDDIDISEINNSLAFGYIKKIKIDEEI